MVHDRTGELPDRLRTYAERKLVRLSRHFDRVLAAEVEFKPEKRRSQDPAHVVTITVHMDGRRHPVASAREADLSRQTALDLALDKIDRQVVKLKEKIKERKRPDPDAAPLPLKVSGNGPARIRLKLRRSRCRRRRRCCAATKTSSSTSSWMRTAGVSSSSTGARTVRWQ